MWHNIAKTVREFRRSFARGGATYRPDLHYMRGPGPKWHAKYGHLAVKTPAAGRAANPMLAEAAEHRV
jgi:hypothetical protein